jgi:hypothetical protein
MKSGLGKPSKENSWTDIQELCPASAGFNGILAR